MIAKMAKYKLSYYTRVVPPTLIVEALGRFDVMTALCRLRSLSLDGSDTPYSHTAPERLRTADELAASPTRYGGFGHLKQGQLAAAAWLASVVAILPASLELQDGRIMPALQPHVESAYMEIADLLHAQLPLPPDHPVAQILPASADELCDIHSLANPPTPP